MESNIDFSSYDALLEFLIDSPGVPLLKNSFISYLVLIKDILVDSSQQFVGDGTILQVAASLVSSVESILSSFDLNKMNEYMSLELCLQLSTFLDLDENLLEMGRIIEKRTMPSPSYYSKTSIFVFIDHLLENLEELLNDTASSTLPFNYIILIVQRELHFWYSDLIEISSNPPLFLKELIQTITKLTYDLEYVLDSYLVGDLPSWRCIFWLAEILYAFEKIEQERRTIEDEKEDLKGKKTMIKDMLLGGDEELNIITIVGQDLMDNTAFTKELYDSPSVIDHFDLRAYCCLRHDEEGPLLHILGQLFNLSDTSGLNDNEGLIELVYKCLEGHRFLVVIDDVRFIDNWGKIRGCFPDSHTGSRIILTTLLKEFAFTDMSIVQPQHPKYDKLWELFQKLSCPPKLMEVGIKIVRRCKPESIDRVIPLLQTIRKTVNQWEEVAQTLGSRVFGLRASQEKRILDLTCIYLPDHLRSCFFYLEGFVIGLLSVSEFIRFWIAEGFVKHTTSQSLENTAEDYVADLIARNLLVLTEKKLLGRAKTCKLTQVVREFLSSKVLEDNFWQITYPENPHSSENILQTEDSSFSTSSSPTISYQRRLRLHSTWEEFGMSSGPFAQSLFFTPTCKRVCWNDSHDISFIYNNFKFLRILNFDTINIGDSFLEIGVLVLLRYLAVQSSVESIPPTIANLWNLETFSFNQTNGEIVKVPDCIWDMMKLRHINIHCHPSFVIDPHRLENSSSILDNLQTFSLINLAYGDDMEKIMRRLPSIRKLCCVFLDSWDDDAKCNRFPRLGGLNQLVSLKVYYRGAKKYPCEFNLPSNLKKLTLLCFQLPWNEISQLAILNNLEVLKLKFYSFEGKTWVMESHVVFPKLKYLKLVGAKVVYWSATHDQFPHLEHLVVNQCEKLIEIPQDFAYISSLRMVEVYECTPSAENSVRLIQEQHVKHWGHHELKISFKDEANQSGVIRVNVTLKVS